MNNAKKYFISFLLPLLVFAVAPTTGIGKIADNGYYVKLKLNESIKYGLLEKGQSIKLYRALWGEDILIDSSIVKNNVIFAGDSLLKEGEYTIKDASGTNLVEFMVSSKESLKESYKLTYDKANVKNKKNAEPDRIRHLTGNVENAYFTDLQNIAANNFNNSASLQQLRKEIDSICRKVSIECKGTLLQYLCDYSFSPKGSAKEIADNFPFSDERVINTRFGKLTVDNILKRTEANANDVLLYFINGIISRSSEKLRPYLIANIFYYFQEPSIMGQEEIAVTLAKDYFESGKAIWPYEEESYLPKSFILMNEQSLIGKRAPELNMIDTSGNYLSLFALNSELSIIYFYTTDCISCKIETPKLVKLMNDYKGKHVSVYAVYTGNNKKDWIEYINEHFACDNINVKWINVYDPQIDSNFPLLYGIVSTPKLFLIDKNKIIIGRRLSTENLKQLLYIENYTSKENDIR